MHDERIIAWQVVDALREVEHAGTHDMYDRGRVIDAVADLGCYQAADWLAANRHLYFRMPERARALTAHMTREYATREVGEPALAVLCR